MAEQPDSEPVEARITETVETPEGDAKRSEVWTLSRSEWNQLVETTQANQREMLKHLERMDRESQPESRNDTDGSGENNNPPISATSSHTPNESETRESLPELTIEAPGGSGASTTETGGAETEPVSKRRKRRRKRLWAT